jgi:hypothetical protein
MTLSRVYERLRTSAALDKVIQIPHEWLMI